MTAANIHQEIIGQLDNGGIIA